MAFQYTDEAWTATLARLNTQYGTAYTTAQLPTAVMNAVLIGAQQDAELERIARANFDNALALRALLYALNPNDSAVAYLTTHLGNIHTRWPLGTPVVPALG